MGGGRGAPWGLGLALCAVVLPASLLAGCASRATGVAGSPAVRTPGRGSPYPLGLATFAVPARRPLPKLDGATLDGGRLTLAPNAQSAASPAQSAASPAQSAASPAQSAVLVLNVWASWCDPCKAESPVLVAAARRFAARPVRFVGLDESDDPAAARAFLARIGSRYPQLLDPDGGLLARLDGFVPAVAVPSTLIVDARGRVAARVIGAVTREQLERVVEQLLASG
ncbi:MAG: TlpA family protein disulfide reductase [Actinobacteria bacterium]|nr:TlpA family protein disulfide reductase [Actinomycetota bacterium]